jgi:hypothetical protein
MVSTTRSTTCLSDDSRSGVPGVPRKYFWATMLVAFTDHVVGNSTPSCSNGAATGAPVVVRVDAPVGDAERRGRSHSEGDWRARRRGSTPDTQQLVCRGQDVVLHHRSYDAVNELTDARANNSMT